MREEAHSEPTAADALRPSLLAVTAATLRRRLEGILTADCSASPHQIALGLSAGVFAAFPPLFGLQFLIAVLCARALGASSIAALLGTFAGNPFTWPLMWAGSYLLGTTMLGHEVAATTLQLSQLASSLQALSIDAGWRIALPLLLPIIVGSLPLGMAAALAMYFLSRRAIEAL